MDSALPSGERIRNSAAENPAFAVAPYGMKAGKVPLLLRKIFNDDPHLHVSVQPLVVYNCVLWTLKVLHRF